MGKAANTSGGATFIQGLHDTFDLLLTGAIAGQKLLQKSEANPEVKVGQQVENAPYPGIGRAFTPPEQAANEMHTQTSASGGDNKMVYIVALAALYLMFK